MACRSFAGVVFRSLTSHTNVNLSVLEAVLGSSFARPKYAKARAPKTPAIEKAEVAVNAKVVSAMVTLEEAATAFPDREGSKEVAGSSDPETSAALDKTDGHAPT